MSLEGKVALVTGASRGVGRGVAHGLGEAGATVYVTARTVAATSDPAPGTIERTAQEINERGGRGIAVRCDHGRDAEIALLFERIERESGRLDILVNNVHSGVHDIADSVHQRFWEIEPDYWDRMNHVGLRGHYIASVYASRLMVRQHSGLILNISSFGAIAYLFNIAYGVGKSALDRLTSDMATELKPEGVAVISLWPGLVRTELTASLMEDASPGYRRVFDAYSESPLLTGRAAAALAMDPRVLRKTGKVQIAAEVMRRHGMLDETGRRPLSPRSFRTFANAALPGRWQRLSALVPPGNFPLAMVGPVLELFSGILKKKGGFRNSSTP